MTLLVASITACDLVTLKERADQAWAGGSDAVEIRIDTFGGSLSELASYLRTNNDRIWIVTCRSVAEGGHFTGSVDESISRLADAVCGSDALVDFEWSSWQQPGITKQALLSAARRQDGKPSDVILSWHHLEGVPPDLDDMVDRMTKDDDAHAVKIAFAGRDACDSFCALDLLHRWGRRLIAVCMGDVGLASRVLSGKLGAFATYCALSEGSQTAPGQPTLEEMTDCYRFHKIDASTQVFGLVGDPVKHSLSPVLFNRWFAQEGVNAVYVPFLVNGESGAIERFLDGCLASDWLGIGGMSVTMPHKETLLRWLGDRADQKSKIIGAVNTLVFKDQEVTGYNTDCQAAVASMLDALGCERGDLAGVCVDVLGAGGSARAVLAGLQELGCRVTLFGRRADVVTKLADTFGACPMSWQDRTHRSGDVLINCTSLGMTPALDESPMPADALKGCKLVFDVVYNPLETRLLKDAKACGAIPLGGLDMFIRQALMQLELWTGRKPDPAGAFDLATRELNRRNTRAT